MSPLLPLAIALFLVGLFGALLRRSFLVALLSIQLAILGVALAFAAFALPRDDPGGYAAALCVLFLGVLHALWGAAATIAIYRRRGTIHLDELRELQG